MNLLRCTAGKVGPMTRPRIIQTAISAILVIIVSFFCVQASLTGTEPRVIHPTKTNELICLSMRVLAQEAQKSPIPDMADTMAGIGWLEGYVA